MGYHSSRQLLKEWHYYKITRINKKHFKVRIDFKDLKKTFKSVVEDFHKSNIEIMKKKSSFNVSF